MRSWKMKVNASSGELRAPGVWSAPADYQPLTTHHTTTYRQTEQRPLAKTRHASQPRLPHSLVRHL